MGNQKPQIKEGQTIYWPKDKGQKVKHKNNLLFVI
jgi:co-chaperonin GroES (HSP10)